MATLALEVEENKEFFVKKNIAHLKEVRCYIPFERKIGIIGDVKVAFFSKLLPNYLVIEVDKLNDRLANRISSVKDVAGFVKASREDLAVELEKEDSDRYVKEYNYNEIYSILDGELYVISGNYAGKTCRIKSKKEDYYVIIVNTRNTPELKMPIWYLGKALGE